MTLVNNINSSVYTSDCITYANIDGLQIGKAGKGNVIIGWGEAVRSLQQSGATNTNVTIQGNFIGVDVDGKSPLQNYFSLILHDTKNITIGGPAATDGNVMAFTGDGGRILIDEIYTSSEGSIYIANNKLGTDYNGTMNLNLGFADIISITKNATITISDNLISGTCYFGICIRDCRKPFIIQGNKIGTDVAGSYKLPVNMAIGIYVENCTNGLIGGPNDAQKNIIAFSDRYGIFVNSSSGITIKKNSIFCNDVKGIALQWGNAKGTQPYVYINTYTINGIGGTAPPLATIELFYDDECPGCQGKTYIASTQADASGKWAYNGPVSGSILATATDTTGSTSEFSAVTFDESKVRIINAGCGLNNGSISGLKILSGNLFYWENSSGQKVGTDTILKNVGPGKYRLILSTGLNAGEGCSIQTPFYTITDNTPAINIDNILIQDASCSQKNGSIKGIDITGENLLFAWKNEAVTKVGDQTVLTIAGPGKYTLEATDVMNGCTVTAGPFIINNINGPDLDISDAVITNSSCSKPNGSIQGISITGTGAITYTWTNSNNNIVGNQANLLNTFSGKYVVHYKDESGCPTGVSDTFLIADIGNINIDTNNMQITPTSCIENTGSVQGIVITGADKYNWLDARGAIVSNNPELTNAGKGTYKLIVSNTYGCESILPDVNIAQVIPLVVKVKTMVTQMPTCNVNNGAISQVLLSPDIATAYKWLNGQNQIVAQHKDISGLGDDSYTLFIKDRDGCEQAVTTIVLKTPGLPVIDASSVKIRDDQCNAAMGSITSLKLSGMSPFTYYWYDASNNLLYNGPNLSHLVAGTYDLVVADINGCKIGSGPYKVNNVSMPISVPQIADITIVKGMDAILAVINKEDGDYYLYKESAPETVFSIATNGVFAITGLDQSTDFRVQHVLGDCKSEFKKLAVKVIDAIKVFVPNAFSPNGDGKNDIFKPVAYGLTSLELFKIYNRWGQTVFSTTQLSTGWDGTVNGITLPVGTYFWILHGKDILGLSVKQQGVVTIVR